MQGKGPGLHGRLATRAAHVPPPHSPTTQRHAMSLACLPATSFPRTAGCQEAHMGERAVPRSAMCRRGGRREGGPCPTLLSSSHHHLPAPGSPSPAFPLTCGMVALVTFCAFPGHPFCHWTAPFWFPPSLPCSPSPPPTSGKEPRGPGA